MGSIVGIAAVLAGCGYSRTPAPNVASPVAIGFAQEGFPRVGIDALIPDSWSEVVTRLPLAATISSGAAVIALWRYPRSVPPPANRLELASARTSLIAAARARDRSLHVIRSKLTHIGGAPTVALDAFERINGHRRRVRSLHLYVVGAEIVIEEYTPPAEFHEVDRTVFSPMNHSIKLRRDVRA